MLENGPSKKAHEEVYESLPPNKTDIITGANLFTKSLFTILAPLYLPLPTSRVMDFLLTSD